LAAAGYWPTTGGPVVGRWSMGWAWVSSPWDVSLFNQYMDWGNNVWITDDASWTYHPNPAWHCMPHGGVLLGTSAGNPQYGMCLLTPSAVIQNNDPNDFSQYSALVWTSPIATPKATIWGQINKTYLGDLTDHFIIKLESELSEPNFWIDNPEADPNDYVEILYTKINDTLNEESVFSLSTAVEVGTRLLFAVKRNPHATTPANTWPTLDVSISDDYTCQDQNDFMKADLNQDCYINLEDFALFADRWLDCNDPQNDTCTATAP